MRETLRRVRDREQSTVAEDEAYEEQHDDWTDTCGGCDSVEIATAALAELDPLADEPEPDVAPDGRPVVDLPLPQPQCATCGDTGYAPPRKGRPPETCNCPAGATLASADQEPS